MCERKGRDSRGETKVIVFPEGKFFANKYNAKY
jgi:hypothetical protein